MQKQVKVTPEESLELEKLHYEINARQGLLSYMMTMMQKDNNDAFQKYHNEYIDLSKQYEKLKLAISQKYVMPIYPDKKVTWNLDFDTCELTIIQKS